LLLCSCLVIHLAYTRLWFSSRYILVGMGIQWLEYVIGIVGKVARNTSVLSVTTSHLAYFGTAAPKYGVFCVFKQTCSDCQIKMTYRLIGIYKVRR
jgi:hypothetical protein